MSESSKLHFLSTGSGRHSDAAHEIRLIGCCVLLKVVLKNVPRSGSSQMLSVDWHRSKQCIYLFIDRAHYFPCFYFTPSIYRYVLNNESQQVIATS